MYGYLNTVSILCEQGNFDVVIVFPLSWLWNPVRRLDFYEMQGKGKFKGPPLWIATE